MYVLNYSKLLSEAAAKTGKLISGPYWEKKGVFEAKNLPISPNNTRCGDKPA